MYDEGFATGIVVSIKDVLEYDDILGCFEHFILGVSFVQNVTRSEILSETNNAEAKLCST